MTAPLDVEALKRLPRREYALPPEFVVKFSVSVDAITWDAILAALSELEGLRRDVCALWEREVVSYFTAEDRERECGGVTGTLKWVDESEVPALGAILRARHAEYVAARVAAREGEEVSGADA